MGNTSKKEEAPSPPPPSPPPPPPPPPPAFVNTANYSAARTNSKNFSTSSHSNITKTEPRYSTNYSTSYANTTPIIAPTNFPTSSHTIITRTAPRYPTKTPTTSSAQVKITQTTSVSATISRSTTHSNLTTTAPPPVPYRSHKCVKVPSINDVNNYLISDFHKNSLKLPSGATVDVYSLRACPQYNSNRGCNYDRCSRFHVCYQWIIGKTCYRNPCEHSFTSTHNTRIMRVVSVDAKEEELVNLLKGHRPLRMNTIKRPDGTLCCYNVLKNCKKQPCKFLHRTESFSWEMFDGTAWQEFSFIVNKAIERAYCDPSRDSVVITINGKKNKKGNIKLLEGKTWNVDFCVMELLGVDVSFNIRRLSTPSDVVQSLSTATRWIWYWQENDKTWHSFKSSLTDLGFVIPFDDFLERHFLKGLERIHYQTDRFSYELDFVNMTQKNSSTLKIRQIKRRPFGRFDNLKRPETFFESWTSIPNNVNYLRVDVVPSSPEYAIILSLMKKSMPNIIIKQMERIQNIHLWKSYQLKKEQMIKINGSDKSLNEQYMFHGTQLSVIDKICSDNIDWRLFGTSVGNAFGKGAYFANSAALSDKYSQSDRGICCMFIVFVIIGSATVGNRDMIFPPINPTTKRNFDTTVNSSSSPAIFVKYNSDEYYPAYIVRYLDEDLLS